MDFSNLKKSNGLSDIKKMQERAASEQSSGYERDARFWEPTVDKAGNGFATIRFLPAAKDDDAPYVKTFRHVFKIGARWFINECPTTLGKGHNCPVCEANSELWNSGIESDKDVARARKRGTQFIANIYVISDKANPENEGKVFLYKFGKKIFDKISQALNPEFEDEESCNPFNMWEGANFRLKIRNVEKQRNYDKSEFEGKSALSNDDDELERIWNSEYSLKEFTDPASFKSYDVLKKEFISVLNSAGNKPQDSHGSDNTDDTPFDVDEKPTIPMKKAEKKAEPKDEPKDDDFSDYASLMGED